MVSFQCVYAHVHLNVLFEKNNSCKIYINRKYFVTRLTFYCLIKCPLLEKLFSKNLHLNGFSPVCTRTCLVKFPLSENVFSHNLHLNGFYPVCVRTCIVKSPFWKKLFSQNLHLNQDMLNDHCFFNELMEL